MKMPMTAPGLEGRLGDARRMCPGQGPGRLAMRCLPCLAWRSLHPAPTCPADSPGVPLGTSDQEHSEGLSFGSFRSHAPLRARKLQPAELNKLPMAAWTGPAGAGSVPSTVARDVSSQQLGGCPKCSERLGGRAQGHSGPHSSAQTSGPCRRPPWAPSQVPSATRTINSQDSLRIWESGGFGMSLNQEPRGSGLPSAQLGRPSVGQQPSSPPEWAGWTLDGTVT